MRDLCVSESKLTLLRENVSPHAMKEAVFQGASMRDPSPRKLARNHYCCLRQSNKIPFFSFL